MVVAEIATGYSALKAAYEITKGLKNIHDQVALNNAVIELQGQILSAQDAALSAKEKVAEIETRLADLLDWKSTADRYQLRDFGASTFAYELRADLANGEPLHRACPRCFEDRKRSILQFSHRTASAQDNYACPTCKTDYYFGESRPMSTRSDRGSGWAV